MVKSIFRNLISNALKFTQVDGNIQIQQIPKQDTCEIIISDNGIGMSPEKCAQIFEVNPVTESTKTESSGLGLLLCNAFIKKHNGKLTAVSELGKGSAFKFTLPLSKSH